MFKRIYGALRDWRETINSTKEFAIIIGVGLALISLSPAGWAFWVWLFLG
jgi:hypothetical protein